MARRELNTRQEAGWKGSASSPVYELLLRFKGAKMKLADMLSDCRSLGLDCILDDEDASLLAQPTSSLGKQKDKNTHSVDKQSVQNAGLKRKRQDEAQQTSKKAAKLQPKQNTLTLTTETTAASQKGSSWPFAVCYTDHFSTSAEAVSHADHVLSLLSKQLARPKSSLVLYDPFYCQGEVAHIWRSLGYKNVVHQNRDFYADVANGVVPKYDVLVTNPPYSEDHKERILSYVLASNKPWMLLLPNYVANKKYYQEAIAFKCQPSSNHTNNVPPNRHQRQAKDEHASIQQHKADRGRGHISTSDFHEPFYLVPNKKYEYNHPEGTGHASSPFFSIWYVHLGKHTKQTCTALQKHLQQQQGQASTCAFKIVPSTEGLRQSGAAPAWKRPNPRQRKKAKKSSR